MLDGLVERGPDEARAVLAEAVLAAGRVARAGGRCFVTVTGLGGRLGLDGSARAWTAGLAGLAKTAALEWPTAGVKAIDVATDGASPSEIARRVADELLRGGPEIEVALGADGARRTPVSVVADAAPGAVPIGRGDVVLVSGGARGVTASCVLALAAASKASFVLLGRSSLVVESSRVAAATDDAAIKRALLADAKDAGEKVVPSELGARASLVLASREIRETVAAIVKAGGQARYVPADVRDRAALSAELDRVRAEWGPVRGLVHGAGVIADRRLEDKTAAQVARVIDTKLDGLAALLEVTAGDPLRAIVLFSSVAGRTGNTGQADYAAANESLNRIAALEAARRPGCRVVSIGWGPWEGGMVTPALHEMFVKRGVVLVPLVEGGQRFVDELSAADGATEVVIAGVGIERTWSHDGGPGRVFVARVSSRTHPYLVSHAIQGVPVVPVVLVLEWFARAARGLRPDLAVASVDDLKVLKGIRLGGFHAGGDAFELRVNELSNGAGATLACVLVGAGGVKHYTATVRLEAAVPAAGPVMKAPPLQTWNERIYGDVLFHGPEFQVIRGLEGVGAGGIVGTLSGTRDAGWAGPWTTDALALDGGLQLALLWGRSALGGGSLPTGLASYRRYHDELPGGPIRVVLRGDADGLRARSDLCFVDGAGAVVAEIRGLETHRMG
jgi:hypothetical protein